MSVKPNKKPSFALGLILILLLLADRKSVV